MTPLEDKLRAALRESADEIPAEAPRLRLQPGRRTRWRSRIGWIAPLAAAAVVIALIAASLALAGGVPGRAPAAQPAQRIGVSGVPPYYVALITAKSEPDEDNSPGTAAEVRATATGAVLAKFAPPKPYVTFTGVTAAADDRTFVLSAQEADQPPSAQQQAREYPWGYSPRARFFLLHIDPDPAAGTTRASLLALAAGFVPDGLGIHDMALSPDGTSLAADIGGLFGDDRLYVFNLGTGTERSWSFKTCSDCSPNSGGLGYGGVNVDALSWTADGLKIAFVGPGASLQGAGAVRLLDPAAPGSNLLADSKVVAGWPAGNNDNGPDWRGAIITPDGRTVVIIEELVANRPGGYGVNVHEALVKLSAATGKVIATLNNLNVQGKVGYEQVLYTNATGNVLVVSYARPGMSVGILHGDTYTPIPWTPQTSTAAW